MSSGRRYLCKILPGLIIILMLLISLSLACNQKTSTTTSQTEPLTITSTSLPDGTIMIDYFQKLSVSGGSGINSWSISDGKLPDGLTLNSTTGIISGNPKTAGTANFKVTVTDNKGIAVTRDLSINIKSTIMPMIINTTKLSDGEIGVPYSQTLQASGGSGSYVWSISTGALPDGLSLDPKTGAINGTPAKTGTFVISPRVVDQNGRFAEYSIKLTIFTNVTIYDNLLADSEVNGIYYDSLKAFNGSGSYSWSISKGSLPPGLTLDSNTGNIEGTATTAGTYDFTVKVDDGFSSMTRDVSIITYPAIKLLTKSLPVGKVGVEYSAALKASEGKGEYSWTVSTGNLPGDLTLGDKTGVISGIPKTAGSIRITIVVSDTLSSYDYGDLIISIDPAS